MSLISDALRKVDSSMGTSPVPPSGRSLWIYRVLLAGSVLLVLVALGVVTRTPAKQGAPQTEAAVPPETEKPAFPSGFTLLRHAESELRLNGIVQGGDGKSLALINDLVLEEGESIRDTRIVRVESDRVQLEENGTIRTLTLAD